MYMRRLSLLAILTLVLGACTRQGFQQPPFGGMKGQVQEVTVYHITPPDWRTGNGNDSLMFIIASAYDTEGNEICSVRMDSDGRIQSQAESMFENGVCIRSTNENGAHKVLGRLELVSHEKGLLVYDSYSGSKVSHMEVRERKLFRKYRSTVTNDGKVTMTSIIKTDAQGRPVSISSTDASGKEIIEENVFSSDGDIIEKHVKAAGTTLDDITRTEYTAFDDHGNWIEARTYNKIRMAREILRREIKYWP